MCICAKLGGAENEYRRGRLCWNGILGRSAAWVGTSAPKVTETVSSAVSRESCSFCSKWKLFDAAAHCWWCPDD